ncbi:MAG: VCBS repeat-containing protein [Lachnospiraceae bacterium]|nr:VCBS repeat-containing protein [Lachnospiraceae bacterium]
MVRLVPAIEEVYSRLALFLVTEEGAVVYKTEQLETNYRIMGELRQPRQKISAVAFQDMNRDGLTDVILITSLDNSDSSYNASLVGDVLFQSPEGFYRDYRISDKINRFGMNKSAECIIAFVRDGASTEFLHTATTKRELLQNGFVIAHEQNYPRRFEKLGYLEVVPGTYTIAEFSFFMIYLVDEQGVIVWSFQPMGDYDNLYALKGINCSDIDGDGMKDMIVLARYSYAGENRELMTVSDYTLYYQRTGGFYEDTQVRESVVCTEEQTMAELIEKARAYWGWKS